ncbi:MAG: zeta toxin family protein [Ruminococcus sp.]|nr:zeta toxin family protein [Ruminococcus sp.]
MKRLTVFGGCDGAGKTSIRGIISSIRNDLGEFAEDGQEESFLEKGVSFTQETTLSGKKTVRTIRRAVDLGYSVRLYYVGISSAEESLARIANRVRKGGRDIPREDVIRRYETRLDDLKNVLPYCNEVRLYDNENGFFEAATYKNGRLYVMDNAPDWVIRLRESLGQ